MTETISKAIDPKRVGMSKSLMTSPCERKGFFGETVRDADGRRLSFPMPEKVIFGKAIDEAVTWLIWKDQRDPEYDIDALPLEAVVNDARIIAMQAASSESGWPLLDDTVTFEIQVRNAIEFYLTQPDGLARIRPLYGENLRLQGNNGESLRIADVIGTPDYLTDHRVGDLKTWGKNDGLSKFWTSPEMGIYAYLFASEHGVVPETVFYQAYIRLKTKPYWAWIEVPGSTELVVYGMETAAHWRGLLALGRAELFPVNTFFCGDCPFRDEMPEVGHMGCAVGQVASSVEERAA